MHVEFDNLSAILTKVREFQRTMTRNTFPVDLPKLARKLGVYQIVGTSAAREGYIARAADGLKICYRSDRSPQRIRFTIAHEIGHLMFSRITGCDVRCKLTDVFAQWQEERIANRIAAEILMPHDRFLQLFTKMGGLSRTSWRLVGRLAAAFHVSYRSVVFRMLEMPETKAFLFIIQQKRRQGLDPCFRATGDVHIRGSLKLAGKRLLRESHNSNSYVDLVASGQHYRVRCELYRWAQSYDEDMECSWWALGQIPESVVPSGTHRSSRKGVYVLRTTSSVDFANRISVRPTEDLLR